MSIIQISHLSYLWEYIIYLCYAKNSELLVMSNNCEISINYIPIIQYLNMCKGSLPKNSVLFFHACCSGEQYRETSGVWERHQEQGKGPRGHSSTHARMLNAALFGLDATFNTWINKYELTKWGELIQLVIIFTWPSSCDLIWEILCVCFFFRKSTCILISNAVVF